jgi:diguanylate cyclase (GGDEF)-like protein
MTEIILIVALSIATTVLFVLFFVERTKRNKILHGRKTPGQKETSEHTIAATDSSGEITRYLKLKNCDQLMPELLKKLKIDSRLSKVGFYVKVSRQNNKIMGFGLDIQDNIDNILRENHDKILSRLQSGDFVEINKLSQDGLLPESSLKKIKEEGINYLTAIPWVENRRAILALGKGVRVEQITEFINRFSRDSLPLVENIRRFERAEALSHTDSLTGTYNHRYFKKRIREEYYRAKRYERFLALMILDIDDLKTINDRYGHLAGDDLINGFVSVLSASVRSNDIICRYGGDEFCLIMPEIDRENARLFMERIRAAIASQKIDIAGIEEKPRMTASIGGAVYPVDADSPETLIRAADVSLLKAKQEGRNCAKLYQSEYDIKS